MIKRYNRISIAVGLRGAFSALLDTSGPSFSPDSLIGLNNRQKETPMPTTECHSTSESRAGASSRMSDSGRWT